MTIHSSSPTISNQVKQYVCHLNFGKPFTLEQVVKKLQLADSERKNASKVLQRMVSTKALARLTNGTFYRPKVSRFGPLPLETSEIIKVVTRSKKATVVPAGAAAVNALGLDTQLPMVSSYYISIRTRAHLSNKSVKFEYKESLQYFLDRFKVTDKKAKQQGLLFWSALTYLDQKITTLYTDKLIYKFNKTMDSYAQDKFISALPPSLRWAKDILKTDDISG